MVSDAVYESDSAGIYGSAESGVEEVLSTLWLWGSVGVPLDTVLWFDQGFECLHRCHLLLADRFLYSLV